MNCPALHKSIIAGYTYIIFIVLLTMCFMNMILGEVVSVARSNFGLKAYNGIVIIYVHKGRLLTTSTYQKF
jgi:hypothetical protein